MVTEFVEAYLHMSLPWNDKLNELLLECSASSSTLLGIITLAHRTKRPYLNI